MAATQSQLSSGGISLAAGAPPHQATDHQPVLNFTQRLFGQSPAISTEVDPETGDASFLVIAPAVGSVEELVALGDAWHRDLQTTVGRTADQYRLMIDPQ